MKNRRVRTFTAIAAVVMLAGNMMCSAESATEGEFLPPQEMTELTSETPPEETEPVPKETESEPEEADPVQAESPDQTEQADVPFTPETELPDEQVPTERETEKIQEPGTEAAAEKQNEAVTEEMSEDVTEEAESETGEEAFHVWIPETSDYRVELEDPDGSYPAGEEVFLKVIPSDGYQLADVTAAYAITDEEQAGDSILIGEELPLSPVQGAEESASLMRKSSGSVRVTLADGLVPSDYAFTMPQSDVAISAAVKPAAAKASVPVSIDLTVDGIGNAFGPKGLTNDNHDISDNWKQVAFTTDDGKTRKRLAYCLEPGLSDPREGTYTKKQFHILDPDGSDYEADLAKALYYLYGGPGWGKKIGGVDLMSIMEEYGCKVDSSATGIYQYENYYAISHYVLSYLFAEGDETIWNARYSVQTGQREGNLFNAKGKECIKRLAKAVAKLPDPDTSLSAYTLGSAYDTGKKLTVSDTVTYHAFAENKATITLPSGTTLVTGSGTKYTGTCTIPGGTSFHLEKKVSKAASESYALKATYATDFTAMEIGAGSKDSTQDIGFTCYANDKSLALSVKWTVAPDTPLSVSKQDLTTGKELPGASLTLTNADGTLIDSWVSGTKPHMIAALKEGDYTLTEKIAPNGYATAESVKIHVAAGGETQTAVMKDAPLRVSVSKQDITGGAELPGAKLRVRDSSGNEVDSWISGTEPHMIQGLPAGIYTLEEITAPAGYQQAEAVTFEVKSSSEIQKVIMKDRPYTKVEISKTDLATGDEIPGCQLEVRSGDTVIEQWVSEVTPHSMSLPDGTYILSERKPADGYVTAEEITFVIDGGSPTARVEMKDDVTKVVISKKDVTGDDELPGAHLTVTDAEGNLIDEWTSDDSAHLIEMLPFGTYILTETTAPDGYQKAESITFRVEDKEGFQHVVMRDTREPETEPQTEPHTEPQTELHTEPQTEPHTEPHTEPGTEKQTEPHKPKTPDKPSTPGGPKTGDSTPIGQTAAGMTAALIAVLLLSSILVIRRRR